MTAYYNEIEPYAAQWLRNLIAAGHIAPGEVDERSIVEVQPDDLRGFTQCHFFAGSGGWSFALRLADWPDDRPIWTGSCPCQPFSAAGKQKGFEDPRHLWPEFFRLIRACRPDIVLGEQVARRAGYEWWDAVATDLEGEGYACRAADIGAHSVGAPHLRQRLYWTGLLGHANGAQANPAKQRQPLFGAGCIAGGMADADDGFKGLESGSGRQMGQAWTDHNARLGLKRRGATGEVRGLGDASGARLQERVGDRSLQREAVCASTREGVIGGGDVGPWSDLEWLPCSDGKARPTKPGLFPLAYGIPGRVGRLRAYGNAIVPQVAAAFVRTL